MTLSCKQARAVTETILDFSAAPRGLSEVRSKAELRYVRGGFGFWIK